MRDHGEVVESIIRRTEEYEKKAAKKQAWRKAVLPGVMAAVAACVLGIVVWKVAGNNKVGKTPSNTGVTVTVTPKPGENQPTPTDKPIDKPTDKPIDKPTEKPVESGNSKELTAASSSSTAPAMKEMDEKMREAYETFAYKVFANIPKGKTRMISPFSIYVALGMLANGADGNTLAQMDALLGLTNEERNEYLAGWVARLTGGSDDVTKFTNANSVWIRNTWEADVPKTFLDTCAKYYRTAVFSAPFDSTTVADMNVWVQKNTMDMIKKIIDEIPEGAIMYLMNAIALDAKWDIEFSEQATEKDYTFTKADGTTEKVDMMFGGFSDDYLENEFATGFVKKYKGGEFSYVALLPKEGVSLDKLVDSLKPGVVRNLLRSAEYGDIVVGIPKYEEEYSLGLVDVLHQLGMKDAFSPDTANLSRLMQSPGTYVSKIMHKTFITVDEKGTKAAAVTSVEATNESVSRPHYVTLDHPFVYIIVDSDGLPIFLGTYEGKGK